MKGLLGLIPALAAAIIIPLTQADGSHAARPALGGVPGNFVYVCTQPTTGACQFGEVFATYDQAGDPLFTVSPTGDLEGFGLAYSETPLGDVFHSRITLGWESPTSYYPVINGQTGCTVPHWYIAPNDDGTQLQIWHCVAPGVWHVYKTL